MKKKRLRKNKETLLDTLIWEARTKYIALKMIPDNTFGDYDSAIRKLNAMNKEIPLT